MKKRGYQGLKDSSQSAQRFVAQKNAKKIMFSGTLLFCFLDGANKKDSSYNSSLPLRQRETENDLMLKCYNKGVSIYSIIKALYHSIIKSFTAIELNNIFAID